MLNGWSARATNGGDSESAPPQELLYGSDSSVTAKKVRRKFKKLRTSHLEEGVQALVLRFTGNSLVWPQILDKLVASSMSHTRIQLV